MQQNRLGLVSVSFRSLTPEEIIQAVCAAGLQAIEWGGDVHVPAGDLSAARRVRALTEEAGLEVAAYGSYYRLGAYPDAQKEFAGVLGCACALGAPVVRLWAGEKGSGLFSQEEFASAAQEAALLCDLAAPYGLKVVFECHNDTLTDNYPSALRLMQAINRPNAGMYWQPNQLRDKSYNQEALRALLPYLYNVHVFQWDAANRYPLEQGREEWQSYLQIIRSEQPQRRHDFLLEFMPDDNPATLPREADTLNYLFQ